MLPRKSNRCEVSYSKRIFGIILLFSIVFTSCKKYLEDKPIKTQVVPTTVADLQALMDANTTMNVNYPFEQELCADNYYVTTNDWSTQSVDDRNLYLWNNSTILAGSSSWRNDYVKVYYANFVLDQLPNIIEASINDYGNVKGQALFYRGYNFFGIAQIWCRPFSSTASNDLGIPLRLTAAVDEKSIRSTVQQTYDQIISDLKEASNLLPETVPAPSRPNKAAAYGALARTYLSMRDYLNAGRYADSCLKRFNGLIDYASLNAGLPAPFQRFNPETIFYNTLGYPNITKNNVAKIDSTLYQMYAANDLRRVLFFKDNGNGTFGFKGSYDGSSQPDFLFNGIATDEMYLIRAESSARSGNKDSAMADLNRLMIKRWANNGTFIPYTSTDAADALNKILTERRKELIFRGLRWSDLRRLNLENANITLTRIVNGTTYTLPPNDLRWILLIPYDVIALSGMQQNPR